MQQLFERSLFTAVICAVLYFAIHAAGYIGLSIPFAVVAVISMAVAFIVTCLE